MADLWNTIVQSNTFNFAILVIIIAAVFIKIDISGIIEKIKNDAAFAIENAKSEKENAQKELITAQKTAANTDNEVKERLENAEINARNLTGQILKTTEEQLKHIEENVQRVLSAEEKNLSLKLTQGAVVDSMGLAKQNIEARLNQELHEKFIDASLNELDKVKL